MHLLLMFKWTKIYNGYNGTSKRNNNKPWSYDKQLFVPYVCCSET